MENELEKINRDNQELIAAVENADFILNKTYLSSLNEARIIPKENKISVDDFNRENHFFELTKVVLKKNENMQDKLSSVFNALGSVGSTFLLWLEGSKEKVSVRIGIKSENVLLAHELLKDSLKAQFPGSEAKILNRNEIPWKDDFGIFSPQMKVVSVTNVPSLRTEQQSSERIFIQGIEKLLDTMQGEDYSVLLIANPVSTQDLQISRLALENLYSELSPFSTQQISFGENDSVAINESITKGTAKTINESVSNSVNHTSGNSTSHTEGTSKSGGIKNKLKSVFGMLATVSINESSTTGKSFSDSCGTTDTSGNSWTTSENKTSGETTTQGTNHSIQVSFENKSIKQMMKKIDETLERYDSCFDIGMWNCAIYCLAENQNVAQKAASAYQSLLRGKNSSLETGSLISWGKEKSFSLLPYLNNLEHPKLDFKNQHLTPTTLISSSELAIAASLPNRSLPSLPVLECAEFGRSVSSYDDGCKEQSARPFTLGKIFNMNHAENLDVNLDANSLASHTFITGSTGSGKSNTVYRILSGLKTKGVKFLVVEPAKGEYKNVFSNDGDVSVYGTNPGLTTLLRINPFSFPHRSNDPAKNIHILEHLDRLIEIFNVCWPMYAAMPAVLKEAVEKSYEDCGWNLTESTNAYEKDFKNDFYPTFADVARNIRTIIDSSEYDAENKGAYKGSLITRLKSLSNGINGMVFTEDEIPAENLFDTNVIVDLSRVGSSETKSLLMGLLVLKLQEHRITCEKMNAPLRHVTVLEEAHNLLKRTSTQQSQDSGNLLGKSVEMLANAIAEMRTYGEGFVIADQAPGLLDMAVIRNTNTKIIMRLPDKDDRELVGKAANLNDDQITELAKLPCGVAAVYQNEWIEPVLCKVEEHKTDGGTCSKPKQDKPQQKPEVSAQKRLEIAELLCKGTAVPSLAEAKEKIDGIPLCSSMKVQILTFLQNPPENPRYTKLAPLVDALIPEVKKSFAKVFRTSSETSVWTDFVDSQIRAIDADIETERLREIRQCIITQLVYNELNDEKTLERWNKEAVK